MNSSVDSMQPSSSVPSASESSQEFKARRISAQPFYKVLLTSELQASGTMPGATCIKKRWCCQDVFLLQRTNLIVKALSQMDISVKETILLSSKAYILIKENIACFSFDVFFHFVFAHTSCNLFA